MDENPVEAQDNQVRIPGDSSLRAAQALNEAPIAAALPRRASAEAAAGIVLHQLESVLLTPADRHYVSNLLKIELNSCHTFIECSNDAIVWLRSLNLAVSCICIECTEHRTVIKAYTRRTCSKLIWKL